MERVEPCLVIDHDRCVVLEEFERGRQEVFDAGAPIQLEDGVIADQEGPKRQRDIDAEIAAASAATRPEQIGVLRGVAESCGNAVEKALFRRARKLLGCTADGLNPR